ncbi:pole-organizing protein PopZ [Brevundimonas kwangchunensis]|uniref:Pole-organizing protein PopZ n=1 Tax=Brevundimonas kwangchunensis TaxID=322163 RepID=A0ABN1GYD8_9CAUL
MTDQTAQEPTMEEILASIRRIISEDDAPAETAAPAAAATEPEAAPAPAEEPVVSPAFMDETPSVQEPVAAEEDVLELTDTYEAPATETIGDLDVSAAEPEPFPVEPVSESLYAAPEVHTPEHPSVPTTSYDSLVGDSAAASAASAFAGLAASFKKPEAAPAASGPDLTFASGSTVEAMVAEMLRPLLKEWLDANLPAIVEAQVRKEVERIARSAG